MYVNTDTDGLKSLETRFRKKKILQLFKSSENLDLLFCLFVCLFVRLFVCLFVF